MDALRNAWRDFWFRPAHPHSLIAARMIVAAQALWILLSRSDLPSLLVWPRSFWEVLKPQVLFRFGYGGLPPFAEVLLYWLLHLLLVAVMFGWRTRATALAAGILLYHFAPLEELLIYADQTAVCGLTLVTLAMFIIAAAQPARVSDADSFEYRWPVALMQVLLAITFLLSGMAKIIHSGPGWYSGQNVRAIALVVWSLSDRPLGLRLGTSQAFSWLVATGSALLDFLFVFVPFSRLVRMILIPLALIATLVRSAALGYHWLEAPLLLLFVEWDSVQSRLGKNRAHSR